MLRDYYDSVQQLMAAEAAHISILSASHGRSCIAVLAPHAGRIEPMTGEIVLAVAGKQHRYYCFIGQAPDQNTRLHVTSTRFDDSGLRDVLHGATTALSVHGAAQCGRPATLIGGLNEELGQLVAWRLGLAGFSVEAAPPRLAGRSMRNVTNRTPLGGVQLELTWELRRMLRQGLTAGVSPAQSCAQPGFVAYVDAVRAALTESLQGSVS